MKKILNIIPQHLHNYGDCQTAILYKLFEYYKLSHYELLFVNEGHIDYTQFDSPHVQSNTNELLKIVHENYFKTLENTYNIRVLNLKCTKLDDIIKFIDDGSPVVINGRAIDMPWRPVNNIREMHSSLIVGYDDTNEKLICIDPIFESGYLYLPYENIQFHDICTIFLVIDPKHVTKDLKYNVNNLSNYFKSIDGKEYSWDCYIKLCTDVLRKNAASKLFVMNYYNYLLNSETWFYLGCRSAKISLFFSYLYREYNDDKYLRMANFAEKAYLSIKNASALVLKYSMTGEQTLIFKAIAKILESGDFERQINNIIIGYDD